MYAQPNGLCDFLHNILRKTPSFKTYNNTILIQIGMIFSFLYLFVLPLKRIVNTFKRFKIYMSI